MQPLLQALKQISEHGIAGIHASFPFPDSDSEKRDDGGSDEEGGWRIDFRRRRQRQRFGIAMAAHRWCCIALFLF